MNSNAAFGTQLDINVIIMSSPLGAFVARPIGVTIARSKARQFRPPSWQNTPVSQSRPGGWLAPISDRARHLRPNIGVLLSLGRSLIRVTGSH